MTAPKTGAPAGDNVPPHTVTIHVNSKPVEIAGPKASGLQIKEAAIKAGLPVQLDFVLSQEFPNGRTEIVGDADEVTVNSQSRFLAIAPDDNS